LKPFKQQKIGFLRENCAKMISDCHLLTFIKPRNGISVFMVFGNFSEFFVNILNLSREPNRFRNKSPPKTADSKALTFAASHYKKCLFEKINTKQFLVSIFSKGL